MSVGVGVELVVSFVEEIPTKRQPLVLTLNKEYPAGVSNSTNMMID